MDIPFLKKLKSFGIPSLDIFSRQPTSTVGVDIGAFSTKVVQLRYEKERGILETYGELINAGYFTESAPGANFLSHSDNELGSILKDILKEANITSKEAVFSVPASSSFITTISFPPVPERELRESIPFEARRYVPIPISEVVLDWEILGSDEKRESTEVLLVAVPREIVEKFRRLSALASLNLRSLEVETFSLVRSLGGSDPTPTAFINIGYLSTTLAISDRGKLRVSHSFSRGSNELTKVLEKSLGISRDRAEGVKKDIGISERIEDKEITSAITPFVETMLVEIERFISIYNRKAPRTIQKINLTGSGANLKGLVEYMVSKFGVEVARGNPFSRVVAPPFMQPLLRELGPGFAVATGLALREITQH